MLKIITFPKFFFFFFNLIYFINISFSQENPFLDDESQLVYPSSGQNISYSKCAKN